MIKIVDAVFVLCTIAKLQVIQKIEKSSSGFRSHYCLDISLMSGPYCFVSINALYSFVSFINRPPRIACMPRDMTCATRRNWRQQDGDVADELSQRYVVCNN